MNKEQILEERFGKRITHYLTVTVILIAVSVMFALCKTKHTDNVNEKSAELDGLKGAGRLFY